MGKKSDTQRERLRFKIPPGNDSPPWPRRYPWETLKRESELTLADARRLLVEAEKTGNLQAAAALLGAIQAASKDLAIAIAKLATMAVLLIVILASDNRLSVAIADLAAMG